MDYQKIYERIIDRAKRRNDIDEYYEIHHILPRCLGGDDKENNLVRLTAREHFICHYLLSKSYAKYSFEWYKMNHAFMMMKVNSLNQNRYFNSRLYKSCKENFREVMSNSQKGKRNSQYGKLWIYNEKTNETKKIEKGLNIPEGWKKGRIIKTIDEKKQYQCKWCKKVYYKKGQEKFCSELCKNQSITLYKMQKDEKIKKNYELMKSFEIQPVSKNKVYENKDFIIVALKYDVPIKAILEYMGFRDSGSHYKTIRNLMP